MSNTGIRIEATEEVNGKGEEGYRVTGIEVLEKKELPALYLDGEREVVYRYQWNNGNISLQGYGGSANLLEEGRWCSRDVMEKALAYVRAAGQHLRDVNQELAKKRERWNRKVTFVDGKKIVTVTEGKPSVSSLEMPILLAEKIAKYWGEGRLYYRNEKGQISPFLL